MIKKHFSPCINVSVRKCILLIIKAGLDWGDLISKAEISEKLDGETQTSIHIVLNNSPYLQGYAKVSDTIVLDVLKNFVELLGSCECTEIKVEGGWEVKLTFDIDIDTDSISERQVKQHIANAKKANSASISKSWLNRREVEMRNDPDKRPKAFYYRVI